MRISFEREPFQSLFQPGELHEYAQAPARRKRVRQYDGARITRLNHDFLWSSSQARTEIYRSLKILRGRSRNLARNNGFFKKFLSMCRSNIAGPYGIRLEVQARNGDDELDSTMNNLIEEHWKRWCHAESASITGKLCFSDCLHKIANDLPRDGEFLVRLMPAKNPYGLALKFYDVSWLDETFNEVRPGGNRVVMSVELDVSDRPVAYWLTPPPDEFTLGLGRVRSRDRLRVPADEIIHDFLPFDGNSGDGSQARGVPWVHAAMINLRNLGATEEAGIIATRIGASKMGFFKKQKVDEFGLGSEDAGLVLPQTTEAESEEPGGPKLIDQVEPGTFSKIDDYEFQAFDPAFPSDSFEPFLKLMLKGVASALDVSYFSLGNDLADVNFSSARVHLLEERDNWRALQQFVIEHFCRRVYLAWLKSGMMTGAIEIRPADYDRLTEPKWIARGWAWVDPLKEVQAKVLEINNLLDTRTHAIAEAGSNIEDLFKEKQEEDQLAEEYGITLPDPSKFQPVPVDDEKPGKPQK